MWIFVMMIVGNGRVHPLSVTCTTTAMGTLTAKMDCDNNVMIVHELISPCDGVLVKRNENKKQNDDFEEEMKREYCQTKNKEEGCSSLDCVALFVCIW